MIDSHEALRERYKTPSDRAQRKVLKRLDPHCQRLIGLSPFLVIGTSDRTHKADVSPRGGEPGFVRVVDDQTLALPDSSGNNRLDTLSNVVENPEVALIFLVPGLDETLRINGTAVLSQETTLLESFDLRGRHPATVMLITVREAYLHCAKALMRSELWNPEAQIDRSTLPSMGQILKEQIGLSEAAETQEEMVARYREDL